MVGHIYNPPPRQPAVHIPPAPSPPFANHPQTAPPSTPPQPLNRAAPTLSRAYAAPLLSSRRNPYAELRSVTWPLRNATQLTIKRRDNIKRVMQRASLIAENVINT